MALPGVSIKIENGALGGNFSTADGTVGMVLSGGSTPIGPVLIKSLKDAADEGIDESYDSTNTVDTYSQIKDFFLAAGEGSNLWISTVPKATTMKSATDPLTGAAKDLLNVANGEIKIIGVSRVPDSGYTPTITNELDPDVNDAVTNLQALCNNFAGNHKPCRALVGARGFSGTVGTLEDFSAQSNNRVGVVLGSTSSTGNPAIGLTLGQFANRPVQRKISRVKDGSLPIDEAYFSDETEASSLVESYEDIHDKGYIFMRTYPGKSGFFFNSDPSCTDPGVDDYKFISLGRVIDKAHSITYSTFINEIEDDIEIDENGHLAPAVVKSYQQKITRAIETSMSGEISGLEVFIETAQDVLTSGEIVVNLSLRPRGYSSNIVVNLGFTAGTN